MFGSFAYLLSEKGMLYYVCKLMKDNLQRGVTPNNKVRERRREDKSHSHTILGTPVRDVLYPNTPLNRGKQKSHYNRTERGHYYENNR